MKYELNKLAMNKQAGPYSDMAIANIAGGGLAAAANAVNPVLGSLVGLPNTIGYISALIKKEPSEQEETEYDDSPAMAAIPGVGSYRLARRWKKQLKDDNGEYPHGWSQAFGPITSTLLALLTGAGIGGAVGSAAGDVKKGILGGIAAGAGITSLGAITGSIAAAAKKTRTRKEQKEYANSPVLSEYLVPGMAVYNNFKTMGRSHADSVEREKA